MQTISAKILDATHLELSEPLNVPPGQVIQISLPPETPAGDDDEMAPWRKAGKKHMFDAYADEDAVYDSL
jgi:hypothetical protein